MYQEPKRDAGDGMAVRHKNILKDWKNDARRLLKTVKSLFSSQLKKESFSLRRYNSLSCTHTLFY